MKGRIKVNEIIKNKKAAYILAIFCTLMWGAALPLITLGYSAFEIADDDIPSELVFAGLRFLTAGLMVFAVLWIARRRFPVLRKRDLVPVLSLGAVQTSAQYIFTYIGLGFTTATNTSVITSCISFFTVLFSPLFFKSDKMTAAKPIGCIVGFCGVLIINLGVSLSVDLLFGDLMILLSTISASAGNIISKKIASGRDPLLVTAYQLLFGGAVLCVCGFAFGGKVGSLNPQSLLVFFWLAFTSAAAFSVWTPLLKYHDAGKISIFNLLVPLFGTVLSGLLLGENILQLQILFSLILTSLGIIIVNLDMPSLLRRILRRIRHES